MSMMDFPEEKIVDTALKTINLFSLNAYNRAGDAYEGSVLARIKLNPTKNS